MTPQTAITLSDGSYLIGSYVGSKVSILQLNASDGAVLLDRAVAYTANQRFEGLFAETIDNIHVLTSSRNGVNSNYQ